MNFKYTTQLRASLLVSAVAAVIPAAKDLTRLRFARDGSNVLYFEPNN